MTTSEKLSPLDIGCVTLGGLVGDRMDACLDRRVLAQEIEPLVERYRDRNDGPDGFRGEFWGKWFTSLVLGYSYRPCAETERKMRRAVAAILATQSDDGCISTYDYPVQHGMWDAWSRKYVLLGLLNYHEMTGDGEALAAACRMLDHLCTQVGPGKISLADTGHWAWQGLPSSSMLEPVAIAYRLTGEQRYRELAEWILDRWEKPSAFLPEGLQLPASALAGKPARDVGNPKAYEQMSCFEGLCEMALACGQQRWLDAAVALAMSVRRHELTVVGSGSNQEMWFDGARYQTEILEQPQETCATVTWMKLCYRLLKMTGNPLWADELELSWYNALSGSMSTDGAWWVYYNPLCGEKVASHYQYADIGLSCCVASGPRAMLLTHRWAVMRDDHGCVVNLYSDGAATFAAPSGEAVELVQRTGYPVDGRVELTVKTTGEAFFDLRLRIPAWSRRTTVTCGGQRYAAEPGRYFSLARLWRDGETVVLELDMRARAIDAPSGAPQQAVLRGPLVLALDSRLTRRERKTMRLLVDEGGYVDVRPIPSGDADIHFACEVPFTYHQVHIVETAETLVMCDYASAGNRWSADNLFRVWLPRPLFMEHPFPADTWKITYPESETRPESPACRNDFL